MDPKVFALEFLKKQQLAKDVYAFFFSRKNANFDFLPGQYIRITLPLEHPDNRGTSRLFSIVSSSFEKEYLMITTKIITSSFKKALVQLTPGTSVQFFGPMGNFVFRNEETRPQVFLAGGVGVTPFHSMVTYAAVKKIKAPITLFVSFSTQEDMLFYDELKKIAEDNQNIKIIYTISHPQEGIPWQGETGRVSKELIKKYIPKIQEPIYFIAGPPAMVLSMETIVKELEVPQTQIKKENFVGY